MHDKDPSDDSIESEGENPHDYERLGAAALSLSWFFERELSVLRHPAGSARRRQPLDEIERAKLDGLIENLTLDELTELFKLVVETQQDAYRRTVLAALSAYYDAKKIKTLDFE